jgi:hypothetical protein
MSTETSLPTMDIAADLVRVAVTCMAHRDIRYYLCGVHVEPRQEGGVYIVATDGHRLVVIIDDSGKVSEDVTFRVESDLVSKLPRTGASGSKQRLLLEPFRNKAALVLTDKTSGALPVAVQPDSLIDDATHYPKWRKVMPNFDKVKVGCANAYQPRYVAEVIAVLGKRFTRATPHQVAPNSSILFSLSGHPNIALIVMPMINDGDELGGLRKLFAAPAPAPSPDTPELAIA